MTMRKPIRALLLLSTFGSAAAHAADPASSIDTIVISASPITPEDKLATIVETVDRDEILRAGGANLADALANTPGVTGSGFASGASRPVIRGFDSNRVRTLEDGIGSFDVADVGPDHGIPIDPLSAQRIEVIRGAATLRYGSQAIGGVINAINNRVPARLPDEPVAAELTGLYGTNADTRQGSAMLDGRIGAFAVHADGFRREADDYDIPDGTMANSFFRGDGYSLGGSYLFDKNRVGAALIHYDSEYGIPGEDAFIDMEQTKELLRTSFAPQLGAFHTLTIEGGHADYEHSEIELDTGEVGSTFKDDEWDARAEALFGALGPFSAAALGMQFQNRQFAALGEGADYLLPTETRTAAAFAFADAPLSDATAPACRRTGRIGGRRRNAAGRRSDLAQLHARQRVRRTVVRRHRCAAAGVHSVERGARAGADRAVCARAARSDRHLRNRQCRVRRGAREFTRSDAALRHGERQFRSSRLGIGFHGLHLRESDGPYLRRRRCLRRRRQRRARRAHLRTARRDVLGCRSARDDRAGGSRGRAAPRRRAGGLRACEAR